jgi:hypothetical protein
VKPRHRQDRRREPVRGGGEARVGALAAPFGASVGRARRAQPIEPGETLFMQADQAILTVAGLDAGAGASASSFDELEVA